MKKALIVTTVSGFVPQFESNNVTLLQNKGYEVHYAANFRIPAYGGNNGRLKNTGLILHQIPFARSPFCLLDNLTAFWRLKRLLKEWKFDLIHCHTPVGGALTRLAVMDEKRRGTPLRVIYTAHGFHFYKGAPLLNWLLYYPVECFLMRFCDVVITINREDYAYAKHMCRKMNTQVLRIPGAGVDRKHFAPSQMLREKERRKMNLNEDSFLLVSAGELNRNKNHEIVIRALAKLADNRIHYMICGEGKRRKYLEQVIQELHLEAQIHMPGYVQDMAPILNAADCFVFPSIREGLGMAALEAMSVGLPLITSDNRGSREYMRDNETGYVCKKNSSQEYVKAIRSLLYNRMKCLKMGENSRATSADFDSTRVKKRMEEVYSWH